MKRKDYTELANFMVWFIKLCRQKDADGLVWTKTDCIYSLLKISYYASQSGDKELSERISKFLLDLMEHDL